MLALLVITLAAGYQLTQFELHLILLFTWARLLAIEISEPQNRFCKQTCSECGKPASGFLIKRVADGTYNDYRCDEHLMNEVRKDNQ